VKREKNLNYLKWWVQESNYTSDYRKKGKAREKKGKRGVPVLPRVPILSSTDKKKK